MSLGGWLKAKSDSEPAQHAQQLQRLLLDRNGGSSVDIRVKPKQMLTEVLPR